LKWCKLFKNDQILEKHTILNIEAGLSMKNIAYQSGLFQAPIRSTNKEYRDLCERLEIVDRILTESGLEFEFASDYVEQTSV